MNRHFFLFVLFSVLFVCGKAEAQRRFRVAEYNVENLFDTIHAHGFDDYGFTPSGNHRWTSGRYWYKLGQLARTIAELGELKPADIIMLCEVENDSVIYDLTKRTILNRLGYEFIISHSRDVRGINVALLYQPMSFMPIICDSLRITPLDNVRPTRDILHICGMTVSGDSLDVFLVHMPSRSGGKRQTEAWRRKVASALKTFSDSVIAARQTPNIVIMGDFNDEATDKSIRKSLGAIYKYNNVYSLQSSDLIVLPSNCADKRVGGTYLFRKKWYELDHIIVSGNFFSKSAGLRLSCPNTYIYSAPHLTEKDGDRGIKPKRTFLGTSYHGGLSDHLPIYVDFEY